jgi:hypothetical protein
MRKSQDSILRDKRLLAELVPVHVPAGWYVQRNLLSVELFKRENSSSSQWEWLFSAINRDSQLEIEVLGISLEDGLHLSGKLLRLESSKSTKPTEEEFEVLLEPVLVACEITNLLFKLFEKAQEY